MDKTSSKKDNDITTIGLIALGIGAVTAAAYALLKEAKDEEKKLKETCLEVGGEWINGMCIVDGAQITLEPGEPDEPSDPTSPVTFSISGRCTDTETLIPIDGAKVQIEGTVPKRSVLTAFTSKNGYWKFNKVPVGDYVLTITAHHFTSISQAFHHDKADDLTSFSALTPVSQWSHVMTRNDDGKHRYYEIWFKTPIPGKRTLVRLDYSFKLVPPQQSPAKLVYIVAIDKYKTVEGKPVPIAPFTNLHSIKMKGTGYKQSYQIKTGTICPRGGAGYRCFGVQFRYPHPGLTFANLKATMYFK